MKLDSETKDVMRSLIVDGIFNPHTKCIDVSKVLDEDKKLDLWLLEVAIRSSIRFVIHALGIGRGVGLDGFPDYWKVRGISPAIEGERCLEELGFITHFMSAIQEDELCTIETSQTV